ncbi:MAG: hypothetical protein AAFY41_15855, partial [Bacteroidota bacterium]
MIDRIKSSFSYFVNHFTLGIKYALYFMIVAAAMGFIFGAFGGIWLAPVFVAISYVGIFVTLNFAFALVLGIINLFPALFKKGSKRLARYFSFSLAFLLLFLTYFAILK